MTLQSQRELEVTREKLAWLEEQYAEAKRRPGENPHVRELTLRSLKRWINKMKEEIIRFEIQERKRARERLEESGQQDHSPQLPPAPAGQPESPLETSP
jgi:hypothetical protein